MLCKLAWGNVRRAGRDYLVYLLTLTLAVTVFYAFNTISIQVDFVMIEEGLAELLGSIISGLTLFLALVMGFLMVYANNFIMKRRKKEFGLYQVLGMSRGQVSRVMALETAIVSGGALVLGIALGVALSQLMTFFTASLFKTQIADFHFFFSIGAFVYTAGCLVAMFLVTLVFNLRVVRRAKIIDLMGAERRSESIKVRNPWISAALFVIGVVLIGVAYYRLLRDGLPVDAPVEQIGAEMAKFWVTTAMVTGGTVMAFFGLSGFLLKMLQGMRGLYWRGLNMVTLRQLSAKVNTVSFSMAVIAMILFLAITSVTGGMSIADAMNTSLERANPADYGRTVIYYNQHTLDMYTDEQLAEWEASEGYPIAAATEPVDILEASTSNTIDEGLSTERSFDLASITDEHVQTNVYDSKPVGGTEPLVNLTDLCELGGVPLPVGTGSSDTNTLGLQVMKASDYNAYLRFLGLDEVDLGEDGYLLTSDMGASIVNVYDGVMSKGLALEFGDTTLYPKATGVNVNASAFTNSNMGSNAGTIIVPDELVERNNLPLYNSYLLVNYKDGLSYEETEGYIREMRAYGPLLNEGGEEVGMWGMEMTLLQSAEASNTMNGLISYLAIYIGFVLVVACASILTIQQLSGVADSSKSYRILSELGTSRQEILRSALIQQAIFFGFPLIVGIAHSLVALDVVIEIVELFGGLSIAGTVGFTCLLFLLSYGVYFLVTYVMSKGIVRDAIRLRHAV